MVETVRSPAASKTNLQRCIFGFLRLQFADAATPAQCNAGLSWGDSYHKAPLTNEQIQLSQALMMPVLWDKPLKLKIL